MIDERFLSVHPRTELWWRQREDCYACANLNAVGIANSATHGAHTVMHCRASHTTRRANGRVDHTSCIDMRDAGSACGPGARLFVPIHELKRA